MTAHVRTAIVSAPLIALALVWTTPAWAPGSLRLDEVLLAVDSAPKLKADIEAELAKNKLTADKVSCWASRHGRHWKYLAGMRAAPYSCKIGNRELTIEADQTYFDNRGRSLGDADHGSPEKAKTFRESNFRWKWTD